MLRPYAPIRNLAIGQDYHNPVRVIRHEDKRVQLDIREVFRDLLPAIANHPPDFGEVHRLSFNTTKQRGTPAAAESDEVESRPRVVVTPQSDRSTISVDA